jgi:hypothetical protein
MTLFEQKQIMIDGSLMSRMMALNGKTFADVFLHQPPSHKCLTRQTLFQLYYLLSLKVQTHFDAHRARSMPRAKDSMSRGDAKKIAARTNCTQKSCLIKAR